MPGSTVGAGKTVLVLEDDAPLQALIQRTLQSHGFQVLIAADGLDGLVQLEARKPDVIVTDIMMPRLDGMAFVQAVKSRKETSAIPIIFVTARTDPRSIIDGINVGARFYLTKPFTLEELLFKVKRAVGLT